MIPKIIHYCWFGGNELGESEQKYIETWRKFCPDYEIKRWDESTIDLSKCISDRRRHLYGYRCRSGETIR